MTGPDSQPRKPVILTVDDDPAVSRAVSRDLRRHHGEKHRIVRAKSGPDALDTQGTEAAWLDAVVAHGTADAIAARLTEHLDAGADHVAIQVLTGPDKLMPALTELAGPLGLTPA